MRVAFVQASNQNVYFDELVGALRAALARRGVLSEVVLDHFPAPAADLVTIVVPHEFTGWTREPAWPQPAHLARSVALCAEQPSSIWYAAARDLARDAGAVVDISPLGVAALRRDGIAARHLELGYVPEWDAWGGGAWEPRPVELVFLGGTTPRREALLAGLAPVLGRLRTEIRLIDGCSPLAPGSEGHVVGDAKWRLLRGSRMFLHLHRDVDAYFERLRAFGAFANGCVLVTEHALGAASFEPGTDYVSAGAGSLPAALARLAGDPARLEAIARHAYDHVRAELHVDRHVEVLIEAIERAEAMPVRSAAPTVPSPFRPPPPSGARARVLSEAAGSPSLVAANAALRRRLRALEARVPADAGDSVVERGGVACTSPRVSVLLAVGDEDAAGAADAIRSVARSCLAEIELIVVAGGAADAVRAAVADAPWLDATLLSGRPDEGRGAALDRAAARARAPYVLALAADAVLLPRCLDVLVAALEAAPDADAAFPIVADVAEGRDGALASAFPPSVARLAASGGASDGVLLLRRPALAAVGGFTSDRRLDGCEELALWCALADHGRPGLLVPGILARRSRAGASAPDLLAAWELLAARYTFLRDLPMGTGGPAT